MSKSRIVGLFVCGGPEVRTDMQTRVATNRGPVIPGVIDSIADGLSLALAFPLLMTVPVLLDAYYWVGWRLLPVALTAPIRNWVDRNGDSDREATIDLLDRLGRSDLASLLAVFVPALLPDVDRGRLYEVWSRPGVDLGHWWLVCIVILAAVVGSAGLFAAYYVPLADAALGRRRSVADYAGTILRTWMRFLGMMALILGLFGLVLGPPAVLWGISAAVGIGLGAILAPIMVVVGVAMAVFLIFTPEAIVVAEVGPFRAMYLSVNVVRRNLWQTLGLTAASMTITFGLGEIWDRLSGTPPGLLTAVIANAFFAGGLAMAGMIFFNNRLRLLPPSKTQRT